MNTRSRTGTITVLRNQNADPVPVVKRTRAKAARKPKAAVTPAKKQGPSKQKPTRVPKTGTTVVPDEESDSSELLDHFKSSVMGSESEGDTQSRI